MVLVEELFGQRVKDICLPIVKRVGRMTERIMPNDVRLGDAHKYGNLFYVDSPAKVPLNKTPLDENNLIKFVGSMDIIEMRRTYVEIVS